MFFLLSDSDPIYNNICKITSKHTFQKYLVITFSFIFIPITEIESQKRILSLWERKTHHFYMQILLNNFSLKQISQSSQWIGHSHCITNKIFSLTLKKRTLAIQTNLIFFFGNKTTFLKKILWQWRCSILSYYRFAKVLSWVCLMIFAPHDKKRRTGIDSLAKILTFDTVIGVIVEQDVDDVEHGDQQQ